jgi:DNA (cytosine-5)-methyltransferase 1
MKNIETLSIKITRGGHRVYLNNKTLAKIGFTAGVGFKEVHSEGMVRVVVDTSSKRKVLDSVKGSLMDLRNKLMGESLPNCERVTVEYKRNEVLIRVYQHTKRVWNREQLIITKVRRGLSLRTGDLYAGIGLLSRQLHKGLLIAGLSTSMAFANEVERLPADINFNSNEIWQTPTSDAVFVQDNILTMDKSLVPQLDCLVIGYPCRPFSRMQGANRDRDLQHSDGNLFIPTLDIINRANPGIVVLENSDNMLNSDTLFLMDSVMKATGYYRTDTTLSGHEHGDFEKRKRLCVVWVSQGLKGLDLSLLTGTGKFDRIAADIIEPIDDDHNAWKDLSHVSKKNKETGHNHKMTVVSPNDTKMSTITASYAKIKADTPMLLHPTNNGLHRILTASEHANVRRITGQFKDAIVSVASGEHHLLTRTNATAAHMMLGNSVAPKPWEALGLYLGNWLKSIAGPIEAAVTKNYIQKTSSENKPGHYMMSL